MNALRRCLADMDVAGMRALWSEIAPHLPQPRDDAEAVATMHRARTEARSIPLRLRAYSHRWLIDHDLPSGLPDDLKPKAERLYPKLIEAVGIAVGFRSPAFRPLVPVVRGAMEDVVKDIYAGRPKPPGYVKAAMLEAKDRALASLGITEKLLSTARTREKAV